MKFFEKHFQQEAILHTPHKWFMALLISPIHFLEMQYKHHYHLRFTHARKLFFFDIALFFFTITLIIFTLYWLTYDPTIARNLDLRIQPEIGTRVTSGKNLSFQIDYKNLSTEKMLAPEITFQFPHGFYLQNISADNFVTSTHSLTLTDLPAGGNGTIHLTGRFFGSVEHTPFLIVTFSYGRAETKNREQKNAQYILQVVDSTMKLSTDDNFPALIATNASTDFTFLVDVNDSLYTGNVFPKINFTPEVSPGVIIRDLRFVTADKTTVCPNNSCLITTAANTNQFQIKGKLFVPKDYPTTKIIFSVTPKFLIEQNYFTQKTLTREINIVHPEISLQTNFTNQPEFIIGGETLRLSGTIKNTGSVNFSQAQISTNLDSAIFDLTKIRQLNHADVANKTFRLNENFDARFLSLKPGDTIPFEILLPLRAKLPNTTEKISLKINFVANVTGLKSSTYESSQNTAEILVAPNQIFSTEARYYTPEGDQIGRGPLPPTVGKETKYWVIVRFRNSYAEFQDANFTAHLPQGINWTGRSSVSHDSDIEFDPITRLVTWRTTKIPANEIVGLNFEISAIPSTAQIGKYFDLLENIRFAGFDPITKKAITKTSLNINSALVSDKEASAVGTAVVTN